VTASRSTALTFTSSGLFIRLGAVFAGDTAYGNHFSKVYECFEPTRLALLPIGACKPRWFMAREHMDHEEAIRAHLDLHSSESVAIHFDAFNSAQDSYEDSVNGLKAALKEHSVSVDGSLILRPGQTASPQSTDVEQSY
jgi:L-ascorbate metabolism protein UlaG (beta-lactamase superfamily)